MADCGTGVCVGISLGLLALINLYNTPERAFHRFFLMRWPSLREPGASMLSTIRRINIVGKVCVDCGAFIRLASLLRPAQLIENFVSSFLELSSYVVCQMNSCSVIEV